MTATAIGTFALLPLLRYNTWRFISESPHVLSLECSSSSLIVLNIDMRNTFIKIKQYLCIRYAALGQFENKFSCRSFAISLWKIH